MSRFLHLVSHILCHKLNESSTINISLSDKRGCNREEVCQDGSAEGVHLPSPSYWPLVFAIGLPFIALGLIYSLWLCVFGGALALMGLYAWVFEPVDDPDVDHHEPQKEDVSG